MKILLKVMRVILLLFLFLTSFMSYTQNCRIVADTNDFSQGNTSSRHLRYFLYENDRITRIDRYSPDIWNHIFLSSYDSVYYSSDYKVDSVINYSLQGYPTGSALRNTWSEDLLLKQISLEVEPSITRHDTIDYIYEESILTSIDKRGWSNGVKDTSLKLTDIAFTGGNITHVSLKGRTVECEYDSFHNPFRSLFISNDFFQNICINNVKIMTYKQFPYGTFFSNSIEYEDGRPMIIHRDNKNETYDLDSYDYECDVVAGTMNSLDEDHIYLFPNPSTGIFHVKDKNYTSGSGVNNAEVFISAKVSNSYGQMVRTYTLSNREFTVDLSDLPDGMYALSLIVGKRRFTVRLIKQ